MQSTLTRSQPVAKKAPQYPSASSAQQIGMDMVPPYGVYVDGSFVAEYDTEEEASKHFNQLCGRAALVQPGTALATPRWELVCYRPTRAGFTIESKAPDGTVYVEDIATFVREMPIRFWGSNLDEAEHILELHKQLGAAKAQRAVADAPQSEAPFALGSLVTDRDGSPTVLARSMFAPFCICVDGVVVADYGDDEEAAEAHYAPLRLALRKRMGWPTEPIQVNAS